VSTAAGVPHRPIPPTTSYLGTITPVPVRRWLERCREPSGPGPPIAPRTALCQARIGLSYRAPERVSACPYRGDRGRKVVHRTLRSDSGDARSWRRCAFPGRGILPAATSPSGGGL